MLERIIKNIIKEKGFLSISNFINLALYHPEFGYYQKKNPFGMGGDFVTAPQISSLFNEMISLFFIYQFKKNWQKGQKIHFVELGAGNGFFIRDFLKTASKVPEFLQNLEITLVEISPKLQKEQEEKVSEFQDKVKIQWEDKAINALKKIPTSKNDIVFVFSNEFFDAFPINQYIKYSGKWHEVCITNKEEDGFEFGFTHFDYSIPIKKHLELMGIEEEIIKDGEIVEISNDVIEIFFELMRKIKQNNGVVLTIDYGYIKTEFLSTLQSVKNHQKNDVLQNIGEADITYLVNFELLYHIAKEERINAFPPITQRDFLTSIGINEKLNLALSREQDEAKKHILQTSTERLISEIQMGNLFKVFICENYKK
jgi:NADH dehydrogenase [ubiquinone] 1 alpha subcomplex assembly factor 7